MTGDLGCNDSKAEIGGKGKTLSDGGLGSPKVVKVTDNEA